MDELSVPSRNKLQKKAEYDDVRSWPVKLTMNWPWKPIVEGHPLQFDRYGLLCSSADPKLSHVSYHTDLER